MLKRLLPALTLLLAGTVSAGNEVTLGNAVLAVPEGWSVIQKQDDRITFKSSDGKEQAIFSLLRFSSRPTFEDFKRLCDQRMHAERREIQDGFVQPEEPYERAGRFGMYFYGGNKPTGRVFFGYLVASGAQMVTLYVEGIATDPKLVIESMQKFVAGFRFPD